MSWTVKLAAQLFSIDAADPEIPRDIEVAAVLIPVGWNSETKRDEVWMTKRTMTVDSHKGQIGFPGGYREPQDKNLLATALREVEEEIGVAESFFKILGRLDPVTTHRNDVLVFPWVGVTALPLSLTLSPAEVDSIVVIPLADLVRDGLKPMSVPVGNFSVQTTGVWIGKDLIWGASARMLEQLVSFLRASDYPLGDDPR